MSLVNSSIGGYRLDAFIGAGGMGEVYRAVHTRLGRVVAIKLLSGTAPDSKSAERFDNEARIQAGLRHPGIATLYEFLEFQGRPCIVMEYVEGDTIAQRLRVRGAMPAAEAIPIFRKVVEAVAYIHSQGVIHRDLKSNNIKITPSGEVRVLDFGIAKSPRTARVTQIGAVIGTVENLAPEQIEGGNADSRTDVWALGVLLHEMVSGRPPFEGPTVATLYDKILKTECPPPSAAAPRVPPEVDAIVLRCLRKDPNARYQSAAELAAALGIAGTAPGPAPAFSVRQAVRDAVSGRRRFLYLAAAIVLAVLGFYWFGGRSTPEGTPETQTITVDVMGGTAEVWRDGRLIGQTPFQVQARPGERVDMLLRREQYQDLPVQFEVSERKFYSYTMEPAR